MVHQQQTNDDKIYSLLNENSRLVTESDVLAVTVKTQNGEILELKKAISESDFNHDEVVKALNEDRDNLKKELEDTKVSLADLEDESLKLFEEGYRECWGRSEARGLDMNPDRLVAYLGELKERIRKGTSDAANPSTLETEET